MTTLYEGDARQVLRDMALRGELVDSVVTDPPYGLVSVTKRFGKAGSAPAKHGTDGAFARQSRGFMGKLWDGSAIERDPEFWRLVYGVMKPGAYIVAFSSSRTYHHMAVALEAAGFVTHPMIGWTFASGMPKAHDAAKAIDKALGRKGQVVPIGDPVRRIRPGADQHKDGSWEKLTDRVYQPGTYMPGSDEAAQWQGWAYGGQARKPALEPIYVGQKPFSERNGALNLMKHGVGAVNIGGVRVGGEGGRWPANVIHDGSEEVMALFPESKGALAPVKGTEPSDLTKDIYGKFAGRVPGQFYGDQAGSAARFFESYPFDGTPIFHQAKANSRDRAGSRHPTVKPIPLIAALARHVTPPGGRVLDPFAGSGTLGSAAIAEGFEPVLIEMDPDYANDIRRRLGLPVSGLDMFDDILGPSVSSDQFEDVLG
ncbi:MAG: hypothetical protein DI537_20265 [Stutzerimonas stutzeri]|nr:MAG: hypothetical protein DI537_20265 [Stutzerimonas stutzeri]